MPENSLPLTQEEHRELSRELRTTEARLRELCGVAVAVYGSNNRVSFSFEKLLDAITRLRTDLQTQLEHDHPGSNGDGTYL
jgi:hypothetical protein